MANKDIKREKAKPTETVATTTTAVQSTIAEKSKPSSKGPETRLIKCTCEHAEQDRMYGKQMRVHNRVDGKANKTLGYACTVCTPRRGPADKNLNQIDANPMLGIRYTVPGTKNRQLKS